MSNNVTDSQPQTIRTDFPRERFLTTRDPEETLDAILDGLAESILEASDEDILEELQEQGCDPLKAAEEVRELLLNTIITAAKMGRR